MLKCEGYKMFRGRMEIASKIKGVFIIKGDWLYKPEYDCWYCSSTGSSYPSDICTVIEDKTEDI